MTNGFQLQINSYDGCLIAGAGFAQDPTITMWV